MEYHTFISVVTVLHSDADVHRLTQLLHNIYHTIHDRFSGFEFVLVNNQLDPVFIENQIMPLPTAVRQHIFQINLSNRVNHENAILAGLDRANGDYTFVFETGFVEKTQLIIEMYEKSQSGFDIVYLRGRQRKLPLLHRWLYRLFFKILTRYSQLKMDKHAHHTRIISRRALNSLLKLRENSRYLKALYALVGYNTAYITVKEPIAREPDVSFVEHVRTSLVAITSFTTFLRSVLLWIFILSGIFAGAAIFNAIKVKFYGKDIFGDPAESESGWAFLVVLISVFFAITCLNLYIMSVYLSNIYQEIKNRPLYIIESIKRY